MLQSIEDKEGSGTFGDNIREYKQKVEKELEEICAQILELIDSNLVPNADSAEGRVFYYKMKGDYLRYLAEFQTAEKKKESAGLALAAYSKAKDAATDTEAGLPPTHPIVLDLRSTSPSSFMRSRATRRRHASWPRRHSTMPSRSLIRFRRRATRTPPHHAAAPRQPHPVDIGRAR